MQINCESPDAPKGKINKQYIPKSNTSDVLPIPICITVFLTCTERWIVFICTYLYYLFFLEVTTMPSFTNDSQIPSNIPYYVPVNTQ